MIWLVFIIKEDIMSIDIEIGKNDINKLKLMKMSNEFVGGY
jgi:hypothetical protein